jgi:hypothetical protein
LLRLEAGVAGDSARLDGWVAMRLFMLVVLWWWRSRIELLGMAGDDAWKRER